MKPSGPKKASNQAVQSWMIVEVALSSLIISSIVMMSESKVLTQKSVKLKNSTTTPVLVVTERELLEESLPADVLLVKEVITTPVPSVAFIVAFSVTRYKAKMS